MVERAGSLRRSVEACDAVQRDNPAMFRGLWAALRPGQGGDRPRGRVGSRVQVLVRLPGQPIVLARGALEALGVHDGDPAAAIVDDASLVERASSLGDRRAATPDSLAASSPRKTRRPTSPSSPPRSKLRLLQVGCRVSTLSGWRRARGLQERRSGAAQRAARSRPAHARRSRMNAAPPLAWQPYAAIRG